jgi:IPT/TIG domain
MIMIRIKDIFAVLALVTLLLPLQLLVFQPATVKADGSRKYIPTAEIEPVSGPVGTEVIVTGAGFRTSEDGITITYDGKIIKCNLIADTIGNWKSTATIPPSTKGRHTIGVFGSDFTPRGVVRDSYFDVIPEISLVSQTYIEPISKKTTIKLKVTGTGFTDNESIKITFDESELTAAIADDSGSFNAILEVPQVRATKEYVIAAAGSDSSSAQAKFFTEKSPPPAPRLLSPVPGTRFEIFSSPVDVIYGPARYFTEFFNNPGVSTPKSLKTGLATFVWTSTALSANVSYNLQITHIYDFSSPVIVKEGLKSPSYTLSGDDVLTPGIYNWRVKTVDDGGDESEWSEARQFEVILISDRVLTVLVVGLLLLIGALVVVILTWRVNSSK